MKTRYCAYLVLGMVMGTLLFCGDDDKPSGPGGDPVNDYSLIGIWEGIVPPRVGALDTTVIRLDLSNTNKWHASDSSFYLYATENTETSQKYLYKRKGAWGIKGTSVELTGTDCQMIDINETTYELKQAVDSIRNLVITIDTTGATEKIDSIWTKIPLVDLGGIVKSFPLYKTFPGFCESLVPDFLKVQGGDLE